MIRSCGRKHPRSLHVPAKHIAIGIALLSACLGIARAQDSDNPYQTPVQLRTLTMTGNVPAALEQQIATSLQGGTYDQGELQGRILQQMLDAGYYNARVLDAQQTDIRQQDGIEVIDLAVRVRCGEQYHIGQVTFTGAKAFPETQLRGLFPVTQGALYNATAVDKGIDQLRKLYQSAGYANFSVIPKAYADEAGRVVNLTMDIDEGGVVNFGRLMLDGVEPRAGAAQVLTTAWKDMQGKRYNPQALQQWLAAHTGDWPKGTAAQIRTEAVADPDPHVIDVVVHFQ